MIIYLIILVKFFDFDFDDPFATVWTRFPLQFFTLLPITLIIVINEFFLDEKYEVFDTKSSLLGIIIMWGIVLFVAVILIAGLFSTESKRN